MKIHTSIYIIFISFNCCCSPTLRLAPNIYNCLSRFIQFLHARAGRFCLTMYDCICRLMAQPITLEKRRGKSSKLSKMDSRTDCKQTLTDTHRHLLNQLFKCNLDNTLFLISTYINFNHRKNTHTRKQS